MAKIFPKMGTFLLFSDDASKTYTHIWRVSLGSFERSLWVLSENGIAYRVMGSASRDIA